MEIYLHDYFVSKKNLICFHIFIQDLIIVSPFLKPKLWNLDNYHVFTRFSIVMASLSNLQFGDKYRISIQFGSPLKICMDWAVKSKRSNWVNIWARQMLCKSKLLRILQTIDWCMYHETKMDQIDAMWWFTVPPWPLQIRCLLKTGQNIELKSS